MLKNIYLTVEKILTAKKVKEFDLYFEREISRTFEVKDQVLESAKEAVQVGVGLRIFKDHRVSFVYSTDLSETGINGFCEAAVNLLTLVDPDEDNGLPPAAKKLPSIDLKDFDSTLESIPTSKKIALALAMEKTAREYDPRVKHVRGASYDEQVLHYELINTQGFHGTHSKTLCSLNVMAVAEDQNEAESGYEFDFSPFFQSLNPQKVGKAAARLAVGYLGGKTPSTRRVPIVLDPLVTAEILKIIAQSFQGDEVFKERSFLKEKLGQQVYSRQVKIIDDALRASGMGSTPFDGEGQASIQKVLIENGVAKSFLLDHFYAKKLGMKSNASSVRNGIKRSPKISFNNLIMEAGSKSDAQIFKDIGSGILVTETIGMHAANPITGDFSIGIQGFLIEDGSKTLPIKKAALAGNLHQMMADILEVGANHRFSYNVGAPTVAIREMAVSGS